MGRCRAITISASLMPPMCRNSIAADPGNLFRAGPGRALARVIRQSFGREPHAIVGASAHESRLTSPSILQKLPVEEEIGGRRDGAGDF
jgi:hypothetical protein